MGLSCTIDDRTLGRTIALARRVTGMPVFLVDEEGRILAASGEHEVCACYHRSDPECARRCHESHEAARRRLHGAERVEYRCYNGLVSVLVPVELGGAAQGSLVIGQFMIEGEEPDEEFFRAQAVRYGFDVRAYLSAVQRVPRFTRRELEAGIEACRDIVGLVSELASSQARRASSESRLSSVLDAIGDGVIALDERGRISRLNPAAERLTGRLECEVLGLELERVVDFSEHERLPVAPLDDAAAGAEDAEGHEGLLAQVPEADDEDAPTGPGGAIGTTGTLRARDGSERDVTLRRTTIRDDAGKRRGAVVAISDVSEQQRLNDQLRHAQRLESVGRLAGGIAHDFNNLLSAICGYAEIAEERLATGAGAMRELGEIRRAGERAAALTRRLLAFSRKQVLDVRVLDLAECIEDMRDLLARLMGEEIRLEMQVAGARGRVRADPFQVQQVLMNLAVNARDAMPQGGTLTIGLEERVLDEGFAGRHPGAKPGPHALVTVRDDGVGMNRRTLARIFEPFYTTKEAGRGTGLGLSMIYGIVKQHRGYIDVESAPGAGSTFRLYFPLVDVARPEAAPRERLEAGAGQGELVLVVEDEPSVRDMVAEVLEARGYRVLGAGDPAEALELAAAEGPLDLLVSDVIMPGCPGPELHRRLLRRQPGLPAVFMSGYADSVISEQGVLESPGEFLAKPFSVERLLRVVRGILDDARREEGATSRLLVGAPR